MVTSAFKSCDSGDIATGGGYLLQTLDLSVVSEDLDGSSSWRIDVFNRGVAPANFVVRVICLDVT
ncbi:hypothetical protein AB0M92_10375 [Streptomyces sp. NPDC051582]|uniref:hypothetical protein n=1 Tax=Streptomyces sp. NPDC051582 TaxID=3155167 RepID=UPI003445AB5B